MKEPCWILNVWVYDEIVETVYFRTKEEAIAAAMEYNHSNDPTLFTTVIKGEEDDG